MGLGWCGDAMRARRVDQVWVLLSV